MLNHTGLFIRHLFGIRQLYERGITYIGKSRPEVYQWLVEHGYARYTNEGQHVQVTEEGIAKWKEYLDEVRS